MNATQQGFSTLVINLNGFIQLNALPSSIKLSRLDDGSELQQPFTHMVPCTISRVEVLVTIVGSNVCVTAWTSRDNSQMG